MPLLFDNNLSCQLPGLLAETLPGSLHVRTLGLARAGDGDIWRHAEEAGLAIVTKDADFLALNCLRGFPPKIVFLTLGNCPTSLVLQLLAQRAAEIRRFLADPEAGLLVLP